MVDHVEMDVEEVSWAPRVSQRAVRRLYESEACGLLDKELVDEVGIALLLRCEDILQIDQAVAYGVIVCPRCKRKGILTTFRRDKDEPLRCPRCPWSITWQAYHRTFKGQQLSAGGAGPFFKEYVESYPRARSYAKKILVIDRLIHAFHFNAAGSPPRHSVFG